MFYAITAKPTLYAVNIIIILLLVLLLDRCMPYHMYIIRIRLVISRSLYKTTYRTLFLNHLHWENVLRQTLTDQWVELPSVIPLSSNINLHLFKSQNFCNQNSKITIKCSGKKKKGWYYFTNSLLGCFVKISEL